MKVGQDTITLDIAGAEVTIHAATLADLWLKQLAQEQGFRAQAPVNPFAIPELREGEVYLGGVITPCGTKCRHTILLPGERKKINWNDAMEWAASIGGDLLDRVEQALAFATMKDQFKPEWYWSNTQHAVDSYVAWDQDFDDGDQFSHDKSFEARARAVRRLEIQLFINSTGQS